MAGNGTQAKPIILAQGKGPPSPTRDAPGGFAAGGLIAEWHDRKLEPGDAWKAEIDRHLTSADIVLLLVSADFTASDHCWSEEITRRWSGTNAVRHG